MDDATQVLERLAQPRCGCCHSASVQEPCDCERCEGTGLLYHWLTEECQRCSGRGKIISISGDTASTIGLNCPACKGAGRALIPLKQLPISALARCCGRSDLTYFYDGSGEVSVLTMEQHHYHRSPGDGVVEHFEHWRDKEAFVLALARAMEVKNDKHKDVFQ